MKRYGAIVSRVLDDGRVLDVYPLTFGRARLTLSHDESSPFYSDAW
jgi:hypothetical protein